MAASNETGQPKLHRNLSVWEAIGISLALMAPSMAASINPQGTATTVGRAVPIAFALAFVGVLLVAYTFVRLTQRFHHSGSVYGFVGATLGPRAGVVSGWALTGTYTFYAVVTSMAGGRFAANFLNAIGVWKNPPTWSGFLLGLIGMVLVWWLAITPARGGTRILLAAEGITVLLILIVIVIVFAKLAGHSAPHGLGVDWSVFSLPSGVPLSTIFLGVVFGFLSFAGFEAASTLGEETRRPRRDIPRAILGVAIFGGIYFVVVTAVEVMGFGTSAKGVAAFINSTSLIGDLGTSYVSSWLGTIITAGAMISAFGCALASTVGASRLAFAMGRDGMLPARLSRVSPRRRTPTTVGRGRGAGRLRDRRLHLVRAGRRPVHAVPGERHDRHAHPAGRLHPGHDRDGPAGVLPRSFRRGAAGRGRGAGCPGGHRQAVGAGHPGAGHHRARLHAVPERLAAADRRRLVGPVGGHRLAAWSASPGCWPGPPRPRGRGSC